jgi:hypothetical protein
MQMDKCRQHNYTDCIILLQHVSTSVGHLKANRCFKNTKAIFTFLFCR